MRHGLPQAEPVRAITGAAHPRLEMTRTIGFAESHTLGRHSDPGSMRWHMTLIPRSHIRIPKRSGPAHIGQTNFSRRSAPEPLQYR
jgi:hypothetical protein